MVELFRATRAPSFRSLRALAPLGLLLCAVGCGGGLAYTVPDQQLASIPFFERSAVLEAQAEIHTSETQGAQAQEEASALKARRVAADKDVAHKKKELDRALLEQKDVERLHDTTRLNSANRAKELAGLALAAAEANRDWLERKEELKRSEVKLFQAQQRAATTRFELEKAKLVRSKGLPGSSSIDLPRFETQWQETDAVYQAAKVETEKKRCEVTDAEKRWQTADQRCQEIRNGK